jgi:NADPH:quinone reductase-like Zn-dependent oxidoreductase
MEEITKNGELYDLILVANGTPSIFKFKHSLRPNGVCIQVGGGSNSIPQLVSGIFLEWWMSKTKRKR